MRRQHNRTFLLSLIAALTAGLLSACGASAASPTPTPTTFSVEAIYTAAAQTMIAQLTGAAAANPTATPTPSATITPTGTITPTPTNTSVQYAAPLLPLWTPTTTGTPGTPTPTPTATFGAVGCNNSALLQDVTIPSGTVIDGGYDFTKTWLIQNTGTCAWAFGFKFTFIGGDLMNSDTFKIRRTVGPNLTTEISVVLTAPDAPGTYTGYWRMADDKGVQFGASFMVSIKVAGATYTPPAAATATETTAPAVFTATSTTTPRPSTSTPRPPTVTREPATPTATTPPPPPPTDTVAPPPPDTETPAPPTP
jgi:hypothetical protein